MRRRIPSDATRVVPFKVFTVTLFASSRRRGCIDAVTNSPPRRIYLFQVPTSPSSNSSSRGVVPSWSTASPSISSAGGSPGRRTLAVLGGEEY